MKILLFGKAGSGKDTVANMLKEEMETPIGKVETIAMADPMKRLAGTFGFTFEQLWGPSQRRNEEVFTRQQIEANLAPMTAGLSGPVRVNLIKRVAAWAREEDLSLDISPSQMFGGRSTRDLLIGWFLALMEEVAVNTPSGKLSARRFLQTFGTEFGREVNRNLWIDWAIGATDRLLTTKSLYTQTGGVCSQTDGRWNRAVIITDGRFRNEIVHLKTNGFKVVHIYDSTSNAVSAAPAHGSEAEQDTIPESWFDIRIRNNKGAGLDYLRDIVHEIARDLSPAPLVFW